MTLPHPSPLALVGIPALALLVAGLFVVLARASVRADGPAAARGATVRATLYAAALFTVTGTLAASGLLADVTRRPPLFLPMMAAVLISTVLVSRSALGKAIATNTALVWLVAAQGFRLPLELVMHELSLEGVMPPQMSFQGLNFDIVTGATALALAGWMALGRVPRGVILAWNVMGSVLLFTIVSVALLSAPFVGAFGPDRLNVFVFHVPYVWLATVLVPFALFGHLSIYRALRAEAADPLRRGRTDEPRGHAAVRPPARA